MRLTIKAAIATLGASLLLASCGQKPANAPASTAASADKEYAIGWTIYAGWMPWPYAQQAGIVKKWADKYHVKIKLVQINDYVESLNQYTAGKLDGVTSTNMDALTIPAAGGRDSTVVMVGDYSNGNDGVVLKGSDRLGDIKGRSLNLVQNSVSQYLLSRALESAGLKPADVRVVNTSDADIVAAFAAPTTKAVVAWNPQLLEINKQPDAHEVFDSRRIPGEIEDTLVVSTEALKANPNLGKALTGIWYETLARMTRNDDQGKQARAAMAQLSGATADGFDTQLKTTFFYATPKAALDFMTGQQIVTANDRVRTFSFASGLFGAGAKSADEIGIQFPGGKVLGSAQNIKLRYDSTYVSAAVAGQL
jgi:NitT/TauT family transport system substrate-binding protein